jgi:RNA polymerase sigma factor for flagellar operon FliA
VKLESDTESKLWLRYESREPDAEDQLLAHYGGIVDIIAHQLKKQLPPHILLDDLKAAGKVGLWKAIRNFTTEHGVEFGTYAQHRVKGEMLDELRRSGEQPKGRVNEWKKAAQAYGLQQSNVPHNQSLDVSEHEWIVDDSAVSPEEAVISADVTSMLNRFLVRLGKQEQLVLSLVFVEGLTITEAAEVLNLSKARISSVYHGALKSLRGSMAKNGIRVR